MKRENAKKRLGRTGWSAADIVATVWTISGKDCGTRWLNDHVRRMAERAIGVDRLAVGMGMAGLHHPAQENEGTAEEGERYPERMTCSRVNARPHHCWRL